jgi:HK97 gp10 family phage protein
MAKKGIKIDFSDVRAFEKRLRDEARNSKNQLKRGMTKAITLLHRESVNNTKAGVLYFDGVYERGDLRRSIAFEVPKPDTGIVFISKGLKYPTFVEKGTRRMRAKPFMLPALTSSAMDIAQTFEAVLKKSIRNLAK